jgi:hypothetical protein
MGSTPNTQLFPTFNDPNALFDFHKEMHIPPGSILNPEFTIWTPSNNPMDGLDFMYWMSVYMLREGGCHTTKTIGSAQESDNLPEKC